MKTALFLLGTLSLLWSCTPSTNSQNQAGNDTLPKVDSAKMNANRVAAVDTQVIGIEVLENTGAVDWAQVKGADVDFAFIHACTGDDQAVAAYAGYRDAARREGVPVAPVHQFMVGRAVDAQAKHFFKVSGHQGSDLPPVVRMDGGSIPPNVRVNPAGVRKEIPVLLGEIEKAFQCKPIILTDVSFAKNYLTDPKLGEYALCLFAPDTQNPEKPLPWAEKGWAYWVFSSNGTIPGIGSNVSRIQYHSTSTEFEVSAKCVNP